MPHGLLALELRGVANVVQEEDVVELPCSLFRGQNRVAPERSALNLGDAHLPQRKDRQSLEQLPGTFVQREDKGRLVGESLVIFSGIPGRVRLLNATNQTNQDDENKDT